MSSAEAAAKGGRTVKQHYDDLVRQYEEDVLDGSLPSGQSAYQELVARLRTEFEGFWQQLLRVQALSSNESLEDVSTTTLTMLWTPYVIADLYQRTEGSRGYGEAPSNQEQDNRVTSNAAMAGSSSFFPKMTREAALANSQQWLDVFFQIMLQLELVDEKTIETYRRYRPDQRQTRIELSRLKSELEGKLRQLRSRAAYCRAKQKRTRDLMKDEATEAEEDKLEDDGELEEALRELALARLKWAIYDGCSQIQLTSRELEMLQSLKPTDRERIAQNYQNNLDAVTRGEKSLGKNTYTILPGGLITPGPLQPGMLAQQPSSITAAAISGKELFRQQVCEELMMERNRPTMTLDEFAESEMALMQQQMEAEANGKREMEEEEARLGPDGVEERDRQKDSKWDDWKDNHPKFGKTNKGNYS